MAESPLEALLALQIRAAKLPEPKREYIFSSLQKWRADFAWPEKKLLVEVEGGIYMKDGGGRHNRGKGMEDDMLKYNTATLDGWRLLRFSGGMIKRGEALRVIEKALT